jgi:hypothetical protein
MNQLTVIPDACSPPAAGALIAPVVGQEVGVLAQESATAYRNLVEGYKKLYKVSLQEALAKADRQPADGNNLVGCAQDRSAGYELGERNPELALECWQNIRKHALNELQSGHRSAKAMEAYGNHHCWERAQFLAIREDLAADWKPRNGIERQLIDVLAQAQTTMVSWMSRLATYSGMACANQKAEIRDQGKWNPPRISESQANEQAATMYDRFNRIFMRTLRALRDLPLNRLGQVAGGPVCPSAKTGCWQVAGGPVYRLPVCQNWCWQAAVCLSAKNLDPR